MLFMKPTTWGWMKYDITGVVTEDLKDLIKPAHVLQYSITLFALKHSAGTASHTWPHQKQVFVGK